MLIYLLRHGLTEYNAQKRYQGQRVVNTVSPESRAHFCSRFSFWMISVYFIESFSYISRRLL